MRLYSRDLNDVSTQFPEVVDAARPLGWTGVIDGEILAWKDGLVLPFQSLQARLGRKSPSDAIRAEVPVIFVAFDLLALGPGDDPDGDATVEPLLREPLRERRLRLDAIELPLADAGGRFIRSHLGVAVDADALEVAFADSRARRNEGLMVKDPTSIYSPGRRGLGWLKMKKALATIDCVVVGVEVGHGKRHGVLSDYTFAVRDTDDGQARQHRQGLQRPDRRRDRRDDEVVRGPHDRHVRALPEVEPTVVVEIAFDVIVRSKRHGSGFSLRFPRIAALRPDKSVDEIDTVDTVTALYEGLQHGSELLVTAGARTVPPATG